MQPLPAMATPALSRQLGAWAIAACVFGGGTATPRKPNVTLDESVVITPSATQPMGAVFCHRSTQNVLDAKLTRIRAWENSAAARIFASAVALDILRASLDRFMALSVVFVNGRMK